jgi:phage gpG-like protein
VIQFTILGVEKLKATAEKARGLKAQVHDAVVKETGLAGQDIVATSKKKYLSGRPGLNVRTGNLRSRINYSTREDGDHVFLTVGTDVIYGRIHEYGGQIVAKNAPALRFQVDGKWAFAKSVYIPPRPYLAPAVAENMDPFQTRIGQAIYDLFGGITK